MTFDEYSILFKKKAINTNRSEKYIEKCLQYASNIAKEGLPIIYDLKHLSLLTGISENYYKRFARFPRSFYYTYKIPKKNNKGFREISQPFPNLKMIQTWILQEVLCKIAVHPCAKAYVKGRRLKENARFHRKRKFVLSFDVEDFFHSIKKELIESFFKSLGYSTSLANMFAKLTTLRGGMPQGAPTSPYLSNIILKKFDSNIFEFAKQNELFYTRYADDITISSDLDTIDKDFIEQHIKIELAKLSLKINVAKTKFMPSKNRQIVTGVIVNEKIQAPSDFRRKIRIEVYYITKFGLERHAEVNKIENIRYYIRGLAGRINFALQLNPNDKNLLKYKKIVNDLIIRNIDIE